MVKTSIIFSEKNYEYDVYSLVRAFYPQDQVQILYKGEENTAGEFDRIMTVDYLPDKIIFSIFDQGREIFSEKRDIVSYDRRRDTKDRLKQLVYKALCQVTGKTMPWGSLSGIRPTKIPLNMLEEGSSEEEVRDHMRQVYHVSQAKIDLAIDVAKREKELLKDFAYDRGYSLYVGIPFCPSICLYCSFGSHPLKIWKREMANYLKALKKELDYIAGALPGRRLNSIYIGGGTPTTLEAEEIDELLSYICSRFDMTYVREFTVEAGRPDSITESKLAVIRKFPVDRISINPQTMHQKTLDIIGREHSVEDFESSYALARKMGFDNINMDLIVGLPGEGKEELAYTLEKIKRMDPDSLTIHSLALKRAARLSLFKEKFQEISFENSEEIMDMTRDYAYSMGMAPYYLYRQKNIAGNFENVGYAKVDKAGIYNILIMEEKQTILAAGAGASTKLVFDEGKRIERVENVKDLRNYLDRIDEMIRRKEAGIQKWLT